MALQPMKRTAFDVTTKTGELLPHLFTFAPFRRAERGSYSLFRYYTLPDIFQLRSMALRVALNFLFKKSDRTTCNFFIKLSVS